MGFNRFSLLLALRLALVMLLLVGLVYTLVQPGFHAATLLLVGVIAFLVYEVFRFVSRTNHEVSRFLDAARYADFGQRFDLGSLGAGFEELGETFTEILERLRSQRSDQEAELRHLKALLEHVPVPLVSLHSDGQLTLWNNPARRLFGGGRVTRVEDLAAYGEEFAERVQAVQPGERQLATFIVDGMERRLTVAASQLILRGDTERLVSLQDIQGELDGMQLEAWQDLVRVLTHEIMNSVTPVASLAKTTVDLVDDAAAKVTDHPDVVSELADVKDAVQTVARRSDSLMDFVASYRRLTQLPPPERAAFPVVDMLQSVAQLVGGAAGDSGAEIDVDVVPADLEVVADRGMLEQVLLNLVRNGEQALADVEGGRIRLLARRNRRGNVCIDVEDNGPGVPPDLRRRIFVPFFTTKRDGSGVGLALSRQVMIAHGGTISVADADGGGTRFTLTL